MKDGDVQVQYEGIEFLFDKEVSEMFEGFRIFNRGFGYQVKPL